MIQINQLKLPIYATEEDVLQAVCKELRIKNKKDIKNIRVLKRSVDSRKKPDLYYVYHLAVDVLHEEIILKHAKNNICLYEEYEFSFPKVDIRNDKNIVIVGMGPAGLFAGLMLSRAGYKPLIIERGQKVEDRIRTVEDFFANGNLNPKSNVQFGEGGAGTFSDGKLNTMIKDKSGFISYVLKTFVEHGADEDILYVNKPHIGTDVLSRVVISIREEIIRLGGKILYETLVSDFVIKNGAIEAVVTDNGKSFACDHLVLATGHSSRDTYRRLEGLLNMEQKPFAVGLRAVHPQRIIDDNAYGDISEDLRNKLGAAPYKLTYNTSTKRGVYSFCMCPGGYVINASSEKGRLAVNGMSYHDRASGFANSAIIVSVGKGDYEDRGILSGMYFQEEMEERAYKLCDGAIPVAYLSDFKKRKASVLKEGHEETVGKAVKGSYKGADVSAIYPEFINKAICEGMEAFGHKINGFDMDDTLLMGAETRTSAPVRIVRDETFQSNIRGIYPCGEGAGYAGGITSAAVDGIKVALAISSDDVVQ